MTPQPRKSIKIPTSTIKPTAFPRMSLATDDLKSVRNVRDKAYKQLCLENILKFLTKNEYDGLASVKTLSNPSNKDFQNIYKFIHSFIDSTPFTRFEDDVMGILKMLKYPHSGEITRSQLSAVTPHTWPVLLSMMSWMVDLINKSYEEAEKTTTVECEFFEFLCEGYSRFMEGNEDDTDIEEGFIIRMTSLHSKEGEENENLKKEVDLMAGELENIKSKFTDLTKLENKKKKINEDLNMLILHERQLETKKIKYVSNIEKIAEEIKEVDDSVEILIKMKNDLADQVNKQTINPEDIKGMNVEKIGLLKELEKLKPEKEYALRALQEVECNILEKLEENENYIGEINSYNREILINKDGCNGVDYSVIASLEDQLSAKGESLINYEINIATLEEKISDKNNSFKDLEDQWAQRNSKLQTIGAIYLEKKEISDRSQQRSRNDVDKLDNDLLKLKLENDSAFLKSEKDYSETKIRLDILKSAISREREEIHKAVWDFYNNAGFLIKSLDVVGKDVKKLLK